jgi:hypothetical protein
MKATPTDVRLLDAPDESRTTATLLASLTARLAALQVTTGSVAVGSLVAGFCALGRSASRTTEGARMRQALERSRVGSNGAAIWRTLHLDSWAASVPPSPILDQLRNDTGLLLADDLEESLALLPIPAQPAGARGAEDPWDEGRASFLDCMVGMWAYSREVVAIVEGLAAPTLPPPNDVRVRDEAKPPSGPVLR